ncbi:hypothetical protein PRK78_002913 [Emydomyces testavorans]|uniref:Uncharacterized protein n=1 Tax=Emydomyces testavorans TaxID=2070801 RepID=A0AAF0II99_9EURO|nr:hypothetical protein PRK78_002913 [Emydomyces testavorans]
MYSDPQGLADGVFLTFSKRASEFKRPHTSRQYLKRRMAAIRSSSSEFQLEIQPFRILSTDEIRYCETVLLLCGGKTEDDVDNQLVREAKALGLALWKTDIPLCLRNMERPDETGDAHSIPSRHAPPSTTAPSPKSFSSVAGSLRGRISSSRHSIASLSTCPTTCSLNESEPRKSITDHRPSRHSLNFDSIDRGFKIGLKHAISRIPSLRRRKEYALSSPPSAAPSKFNPIQLSDRYDVQRGRSIDISSTQPLICKADLTPIDDGSLRRSLNSPELRNMRATQKGQMERYLTFRREILKPILQSHHRILEETKARHRRVEEALVAEHSQKAVRLEERDLVAELAAVEDFKREKQALQSRIRHMEAYFNTPPLDISLREKEADALQLQREYGKEYRDRLRQKHHEFATMDSLHESKIKVLRDKQAKLHEKALKKWDQALHQLQQANNRDFSNLENRFHEEKDAAVVWLEAKKTRLKARWKHEETILRKRLELDTQEAYAPLPELSFSDLRDDISLSAESEKDSHCERSEVEPPRNASSTILFCDL